MFSGAQQYQMKDLETLSALNARHFKQIVHGFTRTFDECLGVILGIKEGTVTAEGIQTFQARLYNSLLVLSSAHYKI